MLDIHAKSLLRKIKAAETEVGGEVVIDRKSLSEEEMLAESTLRRMGLTRGQATMGKYQTTLTDEGQRVVKSLG